MNPGADAVLSVGGEELGRVHDFTVEVTADTAKFTEGLKAAAATIEVTGPGLVERFRELTTPTMYGGKACDNAPRGAELTHAPAEFPVRVERDRFHEAWFHVCAPCHVSLIMAKVRKDVRELDLVRRRQRLSVLQLVGFGRVAWSAYMDAEQTLDRLREVITARFAGELTTWGSFRTTPLQVTP